jgi:predicted DNA-binding transcriptional regulator AlpA
MTRSTVDSISQHIRSAPRIAVPPARKRQRGHVIARAPVINLNGPGRLRTRHVLALCGISHSTLYARLKDGSFPQPDGKDGGLNYWNTETIRAYLARE